MFVGVLRGQAFPSAGQYVQGSAREVLNFNALRGESVPKSGSAGSVWERSGPTLGSLRVRNGTASDLVLDRLGRVGCAGDRSRALLMSP
jgi:hypothetical protein